MVSRQGHIHSEFYTIWLVLARQKMPWKKKGSKWEINLNVFLLLIIPSTANMKKGSSVLTPLSTKLCNVLAPNLWDTPVLLTSLESRRWFRMGQNSLFLQIPKETLAIHIWRFWKKKITEALSFYSRFLCHVTWWQDLNTFTIHVFLSPLFSIQNPQFCFWFILKLLELN